MKKALLIGTLALLMGSGTEANADPKGLLSYFYMPKIDFGVRHLEAAKAPHDYQQFQDDWSPDHWLAQRSPDRLMHGFYQADILVDTYRSDGMPALEVGPGFMGLSRDTKVRVIRTVDAIEGLTMGQSGQLIKIYHTEDNDNAIGVYTKYGLQMQ